VIVVPLVLSLASSLIFEQSGDVFLYRALLPAWTPLAIVVAAGFGARRAGTLGLIGAGVLVAASLAVTIVISADRELQRDDWQAIAAATTGEGVVAVYPGHERGSLLHYRDDLERIPSGSVMASEIEVISKASGSSPVALELPTGFVLVEEHEIQRWKVRQYRSQVAVRIDAAALAGAPPDSGGFSLLARAPSH
jgi:hypothetical protein